MKHSFTKAAIAAVLCLTSSSGMTQIEQAKRKHLHAGLTRKGMDEKASVDPELLASCGREAARKKIKGAEREVFMNACVEPD